MPDLANRVHSIIGKAPRQAKRLHGGMIGDVYALTLENNERLVAKIADGKAANLSIEGAMLRYLKQHSRLPVPDVLHSDDTLLLMEYIAGDSRFDNRAQQHAADLLADLHSISAEHYGFERDTLIGGLHQPNPPTPRWLDFFRDQRLLYMANIAHDAGQLPAQTLTRIERLAARLGQYIDEPAHPALLHGDVWTTNVLADSSRITAFLDPGIYYGHPEIELAFITLFNTFDAPFFTRYQQHHPITDGFWQQRRDLYNLYPLMVHVRLFGGGYVNSVSRILGQFSV